MTARSMTLVALLTLVGAGAARGALIATVTASQDAMIFQNNQTFNGGGAIVMYAGTNTANSARRGLVQFNLAGALPTDAVIEGVQLTLTYATYSGTGGGAGSVPDQAIGIYRLLGSWGEGDRLAGTGVGGVGQGAQALAGEVTWLSRFHDTPRWTTPGGDFVPTASAVASVGGTTLDVPFTWGSTAAMVADVQGWLANPASNAGWMLIGNEAAAGTFRGFYTSEAAAAFRPTLTIRYNAPAAVPEPASLGLLAGGAVVLVAARRRRAPRATA